MQRTPLTRLLLTVFFSFVVAVDVYSGQSNDILFLFEYSKCKQGVLLLKAGLIKVIAVVLR